MLDTSVLFHAIADRRWFNTYSTVRHGCVEVDNLGGDIAAIGDVHVVFTDGASMVLHDVRHMPQMTHSVIFISQLRDEGYAFRHTEQSWRLHRGLLVIAKGAKSGMIAVVLIRKFCNHSQILFHCCDSLEQSQSTSAIANSTADISCTTVCRSLSTSKNQTHQRIMHMSLALSSHLTMVELCRE